MIWMSRGKVKRLIFTVTSGIKVKNSAYQQFEFIIIMYWGNISVVVIVIKFSLLGVETMEDWDQETLEKVVESKKTEYNPNKPTEIVCLLYSVLSFSIFCVVDLYFLLLFIYLSWGCVFALTATNRMLLYPYRKCVPFNIWHASLVWVAVEEEYCPSNISIFSCCPQKRDNIASKQDLSHVSASKFW